MPAHGRGSLDPAKRGKSVPTLMPSAAACFPPRRPHLNLTNVIKLPSLYRDADGPYRPDSAPSGSKFLLAASPPDNIDSMEGATIGASPGARVFLTSRTLAISAVAAYHHGR